MLWDSYSLASPCMHKSSEGLHKSASESSKGLTLLRSQTLLAACFMVDKLANTFGAAFTWIAQTNREALNSTDATHSCHCQAMSTETSLQNKFGQVSPMLASALGAMKERDI